MVSYCFNAAVGQNWFQFSKWDSAGGHCLFGSWTDWCLHLCFEVCSNYLQPVMNTKLQISPNSAWSVSRSFGMLVYMSACIYFYISVFLSIYLNVCVYLCLSVCLSLCISFCLCLFFCLQCLSVCPYVYMLVCLYICLYVFRNVFICV